MKNYILDIIHLNNGFTGTGMYMALFFVTLLFLGFYARDKKYRKIIVYPELVLMFVVYILLPFVNRFVATIFDSDVGGRFSWVFMIPAVAALGCTFMVTGLEHNQEGENESDRKTVEKKQMLLVIILVPVIFLCGVFQITDYRFQKAENLYKLPQSLIDISDTILEEQNAKGDGKARIIVPYEIAHVFRQYSTDIEMLFGEDATFGRIWMVYDERRDVCDTMQTTCPNLELISEVAEEYDEEYIVFDCVYTDFGLESINENGYMPDENFVGDRTPDSEVLIKQAETVEIDSERNCWDLSEYGLEYVGTYGQYLLYRFTR